MATVTATVGLKDLEDFYSTDGGFPSGSGSYSGGYSAKAATSGDTISITVYQHSSVNIGYTPTVQLVNTGGSASVSGSFGTSVTVTVTNVTGTGEIRILSGPGTSAGFTPSANLRYRAIIDLTVSAALVAPVISNVTPNNPTSPNVTATVNNSSNGSGGTLEYARGTSSVTPPSSGWQTSNQFTHARGDAWFYFASQNRNISAFSTGRYLNVGYIAPNLTVTPSPTSLKLSSTNPQGSVTIADVASYEEVAVRINNGSTNLATASGNNQTLTWTSSLPAQGATVTYEVFVRVPTANGGDNLWDPTNTTFTRSRAVLDTSISISNYTSGPTRYDNNNATFAGNSTVVLTNTPPTYVHQLTGCGSETRYYASLTAGASAGTQAAYSTLSPIGLTFETTSTRALVGPTGVGSFIAGPSGGTGHRVYIWAVAPGDSTVTSSSVITYTGQSYIAEWPEITISLTPSTTSVTSTDTTTSPTVNVTGDTSGTQYRLYTDNIPRWVSTYNGGGSSSTDFTISYSESELPGTGQTFTYYSQARVTGGTPDEQAGTPTGTYWINTNDSFTISRSAAATYSVSASPTSINEGQSTTYTVTYSNIDSARTVDYTIGGIQDFDITSGALTGSFSISSGSGTATRTITLANDNLTDGSKTATLTLANNDSTGASTGGPSASVSITDTSTASSGSGTNLTPGTANTYGLEIRNPSGNVILNDVSRSGTFLAFDSHTFASGGSATATMFNGFNCSSKSTTGIFITNWTGSAWLAPNITRSSNGITLTINALNSIGRYGTVAVHLIRY